MRINPAMIVVARESRGWTQSDLAEALGVKTPAVCKYELGTLNPGLDITRIADALKFDQRFFEQDTRLVGLGGDFLYRKRAHVSAKVRRRVQAEINILRIQCERLLANVKMPDDLPFPAIQPEERAGRIEQIARDVRAAWKIPAGPISNVTAIVEGMGAIVFAMNFGTFAIDGTNVRQPGFPPLLFLNRMVAGERHRYNLAHEIGHAIMHCGQSLGDPEEEANRFASEFLMPKKEIRSDLANIDLPAAARLKAVWGVSMAALIRRAHDLKLISDSTYRRLFTALSANEMRVQEPFPIPFEEPSTFERLKSIHTEQRGLTPEDMRALLFTDQLGPIEVQHIPRLRISNGALFDDAP